MQLEPLDPEEAVEQYLMSRQHDASKQTILNHRYRLKQFLQWCEETGFEEMNDLTGRKAERFKNWRITECDINSMTLENHLRTFRVFVRWCEANEAVESGVADKIIIPKVTRSEKVREESVEHERAEAIIDYLSRFEHASVTHVIFHLLWHTGMRRGALYGLDKDDWHPSEGYLSVQHRPETDTPLKLGDDGERNLTIADDLLAEALNDYIAHNRHDVTDDHGRKPLLTSSQGRLHASTIQHQVYKLTRPCYYSDDCPHQRDVEDCEATEFDRYAKCPSSVSPHPVRRGAITAHLNRDVPKEIASERMSVSVDTLEEHYDARSKEEKRRNREQYLNSL